MGVRPAAGGGRWVEVDPQRLRRWLDEFAQRHGPVVVTPAERRDAERGDVVRLVAADGAVAECHAPPGAVVAGAGRPDVVDAFVAAAVAPRRIGLLLARRGAVAVGVAIGVRLESSKVDSRYVQGRTAAGGWSQQRFARRRDNQARAASADGADVVARVLLPGIAGLAAVVTGGDRRAVDAILADDRLTAVRQRRVERFLAVAQPRLATLEAAAVQARTVLIRVVDPPG
jgi:hypothetical protein